MKKDYWIAIFAILGAILTILRFTVTTDDKIIGARATDFCKHLLASEPPQNYSAFLYNKDRVTSDGVIKGVYDQRHFLQIRRKILDRIGSLVNVDVRTQTEQDDTITAFLWLYGTKKSSEPVYVDLVKDGDNWYVTDIRLQHEDEVIVPAFH